LPRVECLAVDWSGAVTGAATRIWVAHAQRGVLTQLYAPGSREAVCALLMERRSGGPCMVGLDFAFSMPAWYARAQRWTDITQVWRAAHEHGETWLRECPAPFWGRPGTPRPHPAAHGLRHTEQVWPTAPQPKSVFQVGGAGSVGTGSIRGMPILLALRDSGWAVWPFDAPSTHTVVEIYPRIFTGPVVKRSAASRSAATELYGDRIPLTLRAQMTASEDAFDAGVSAIEMSRAVDAGAGWPERAPESALEGQIWLPAA
jgi:hypothetical protein